MNKARRPSIPLCPVYAITDPELLPGHMLLKAVKAALEGGIRTVQLRNKSNHEAQKLEQAQALVQLCKAFDAQLIINDNVSLAKQVGAHGVHLGQGDTPIEEARYRLGDKAIIGITCHNQLSLANEASLKGADYVAFGRFFSSSTKPDASIAQPSIIKSAKRELSLPVVAIGGITRDNMQQIIDYGADSLAVCHSLFASKDIKKQAQSMLQEFSNHDA